MKASLIKGTFIKIAFLNKKKPHNLPSFIVVAVVAAVTVVVMFILVLLSLLSWKLWSKGELMSWQ